VAERKSCITVERGCKAELLERLADGSLLGRRVEIPNERPESRRNFNAILTDDDAARLRADPRIRGVRWGTKKEAGVGHPVPFSSRRYIGGLPEIESPHEGNWQLPATTSGIDPFADTDLAAWDQWPALEAPDVDLVIFDTGVELDHPELLDDSAQPRLVELDWPAASGIGGPQDPDYYEPFTGGIFDDVRDLAGHGTHMAACATGRSFGLVRGVGLYSIKLSGTFQLHSWPETLSFQMIREWHLSKPQPRRPTVVNMSFGWVSAFGEADLLSGEYRGAPWTGPGWQPQLGLAPELGNLYTNQLDVDAELEDLHDAGVITVQAAGNSGYRIEAPGGPDWDNYFDQMRYPGQEPQQFYHRGPSPRAPGSIYVGNYGPGRRRSASGIGPPANQVNISSAGPGVHVWAPGQMIPGPAKMTQLTTFGDFPMELYRDAGGPWRFIKATGTSPSSPLVAAVLCWLAQQRPDLTQVQARELLLRDAVVHGHLRDAGQVPGYIDHGSLQGGPNRRLVNPAGPRQYGYWRRWRNRQGQMR
jgi:hypothetical protein